MSQRSHDDIWKVPRDAWQNCPFPVDFCGQDFQIHSFPRHDTQLFRDGVAATAWFRMLFPRGEGFQMKGMFERFDRGTTVTV